MGLFPTPYNLVAHLGGDFFPRCKKVTDVILNPNVLSLTILGHLNCFVNYH